MLRYKNDSYGLIQGGGNTTNSVLFCALLIAPVEGGDNLLLRGRRVLGLVETKQVGFLQCQQPPNKA